LVTKQRELGTFPIIGLNPGDILVSRLDENSSPARYSVTSWLPTRRSSPSELGDDDAAGLAKKLRNPVSSLARISFESTLDIALSGDREGWRYTMNIEPVLPVPLNENWNLISRTTLPFIVQDGLVRSSEQTGLGDILQSLLISPARSGTFFWGAGAAVQLPTATDIRLGTGKLGLGPTLLFGSQRRGWTYGAWARQIWSVAGHGDRTGVRSTFVRPFVAYTTKSAWTYSLDTEATYDWVIKEWSAPVHLEVAKIIRVGRQPVSVGGGLRCWPATPPGGPQACAARFNITPLFPPK
jgi:hypothetical protein